MPSGGLWHVEHGERGLDGIVANATDGKARRVQQAVGGDEAVAATRSQVADRVFLARVDVDVSCTVGSQEQQVLSANCVIATAATEQSVSADEFPSGDFVRMASLVDERLGAEDQRLLAANRLVPGIFSGLGIQRERVAGFSRQQ